MGFGSRMMLTESSDESANTAIPPVLHCTNTRKATVLLKRSVRTGITVDYPEGINTHKTHRRHTCPRTRSLQSATPGPSAAAIQLRLTADVAQSQLEKKGRGPLSGGAQRPGTSRIGVAENNLFGANSVLKLQNARVLSARFKL